MRDPCKPQTPYVVTLQRREVVTLCPLLPPPQQDTSAAVAARAAGEGGRAGGVGAAAAVGPRERERDGYSHFTCCTGTNVQLLTQKALLLGASRRSPEAPASRL